MLNKSTRLWGVSIACMALSHAAMAQDVNVTTGAASAKLGGEFRGELTYDDHGFEKVKGGPTPKATTSIDVRVVNLKLSGNINKDTEYAFRFNLLGGGASVVEYGYGTHWFSNMVGLSAGRMKVMQGGWDNWTHNYRSHAQGHYAQNLAFNSYEDMFALHIKAAGEVRLQLMNDVNATGSRTAAQWNKGEHPTFVLGWMGEFGPVKPMVSLGSYDNNKSRWFDIGVMAEMSGLTASLDYHNRNHVNKHLDPADTKKNLEVADTLSAITLNVGYEIKGAATPFLYFSTFENKQGSESKVGAKDLKVNGVDANGNMLFNDNGQTLALGANLHMMGEGWNPYIALVNQSGKFQEGADEKTKSNMWVKLGILGEI